MWKKLLTGCLIARMSAEVFLSNQRNKSNGQVEFLIGYNGGQRIGGTSAVAGSFGPILVTDDAKFHTLTGNVSGMANTTSGSAPTIPGGTLLYGRFTAIQLHSGAVIAYNA
jgi:hypothetical protein